MTSNKLDVILNHSQGKNLLHKEFVTVIVTNLALKNYICFMLFIKKMYPSRLGISLCLTNRARGFFKKIQDCILATSIISLKGISTNLIILKLD